MNLFGYIVAVGVMKIILILAFHPCRTLTDEWIQRGCIFYLQGYTNMGRVKRIWYLSPMRAAKVQASLRIRAVSPEFPLLAHTRNESRGTFRQKAISLAPLNGWACAVKIFHDGLLEDTNSLDAAHIILFHITAPEHYANIPMQKYWLWFLGISTHC